MNILLKKPLGHLVILGIILALVIDFITIIISSISRSQKTMVGVYKIRERIREVSATNPPDWGCKYSIE